MLFQIFGGWGKVLRQRGAMKDRFSQTTIDVIMEMKKIINQGLTGGQGCGERVLEYIVMIMRTTGFAR
jgi:hypothetical protein